MHIHVFNILHGLTLAFGIKIRALRCCSTFSQPIKVFGRLGPPIVAQSRFPTLRTPSPCDGSSPVALVPFGLTILPRLSTFSPPPPHSSFLSTSMTKDSKLSQAGPQIQSTPAIAIT
ncbi:hypothetical protein KQX54_016026 [Cotesia glomerata]|uniref:Uncharacterized protein n=1 Tax=Cotesia glomerata TaxID=32391 RepID=A0AAV7HYD5_COTGL|nr:hypothetical protein KQX54_016026 [Cotesia glomerata]